MDIIFSTFVGISQYLRGLLYPAELLTRGFLLLLGRVGGEFVWMGFQQLLLVCAAHVFGGSAFCETKNPIVIKGGRVH